MMAIKTKRCARCDRRLRGAATDWAVAIDAPDDNGYGVVSEIYCPDCTTAQEHTQATVNDTLCNYVWRRDRVGMFPKFPQETLN
jgi:hypothetical protein